MQLTVDRVEDYAPVVLHSPPLSEAEFVKLCKQYEDYRIEYDSSEEEILIMPPTEHDTGDQNSEISMQLRLWTKRDGRGRTFDSSTGFLLPKGSRRSPDACWIERSKLAAAKARQPSLRFPEICPDFIIELHSPSDRLRPLQRKMVEWIDNGAQLAWLIDPKSKTVTVYRPGREPEILQDPQSIEGEGPVAGFVLDLAPVWAEL